MRAALQLLCKAYNTRLFVNATRGIVHSHHPDVSLPDTNYVNELFSGIDRYADRTAIIDAQNNNRFAYSELQRITFNVASALRKRNIAHGSIMSLFTNNRPEFVFAHLRIMASGATCCPINCNYTATELAFMLNDSKAEMIVTDVDRVHTVIEAAKSVPSLRAIFLIGESQENCRQLGCEPFDGLMSDDGSAMGQDDAEIQPNEDLAVLPYSSGTSGLPKGVMLSHNNIAVNLRQAVSVFQNPIGSENVLGVLPFYHIYALNVIIGNTLHTGGTLVTMGKFEPQPFLENIDTYNIDSLYLVPPLVLFMIHHPMVSQYRLSTLRKVVSAAAPLGAEENAREKLLSINSKICFYQGYGLTETSPLAHCNRYPDPAAFPNERAGSIGESVASQECKIVDRDTGRELGPGEEGELAIRGPHVMKGYWNRPDATADCIDKDGWFHTGDIGYYNDDGYFWVSDRLKELIKYKGLQVAPAEVESVLLRHERIIDCAVVGLPDDRAGELPIAFVVRGDQELTEAEVKDHVAATLSEHKCLHGGVRFVDTIPRTMSGKLLRRELREVLKSS